MHYEEEFQKALRQYDDFEKSLLGTVGKLRESKRALQTYLLNAEQEGADEDKIAKRLNLIVALKSRIDMVQAIIEEASIEEIFKDRPEQ